MTRHVPPALGFAAATTTAAVTARDLVHWIVALAIGLCVALVSRAIQYRLERWGWYRRLVRLPALEAGPSTVIVSDSKEVHP